LCHWGNVSGDSGQDSNGDASAHSRGTQPAGDAACAVMDFTPGASHGCTGLAGHHPAIDGGIVEHGFGEPAHELFPELSAV
jgi:hypothetical protein